MKKQLLFIAAFLMFAACQKSTPVMPVTSTQSTSANERKDNPHRHNPATSTVYNYDGQANHPLDSTTYYGNPFAQLCFSADVANDTTVIFGFHYTDIYGGKWYSSRYMTFTDNTVPGITYLYTKHASIDNCNNECDVQSAVGDTIIVDCPNGETKTIVFKPII